MDAINSMIHVLKSGGLVMIPLGILSVIAMAIIIERFWILRRSQYLKPATVATINQFLAAGGTDRRWTGAGGIPRHSRISSPPWSRTATPPTRS
jgi:hypothetical protein